MIRTKSTSNRSLFFARRWYTVIFFLILYLLVTHSSLLASDNISYSGQWFLYYEKSDNANQFKVSRSYFTMKKKVTDSITGRITLDSHQKSDGDYALRLKYVYASFKLPQVSFFTKPSMEFGLVHRTWLDYEEHVNYYRVQGTMFMERNHLFNSADFGVTFNSLLGGQMDEDYQKNVNSKYPGKYGSVALGVYNGGGYHAKENNKAKNVEARVTLRPVPMIVPGLQFSYFMNIGKGNVDSEPDFKINTLFVSYESVFLTLTGTYYSGTGNQSGLHEGVTDSLNHGGYSIFGEYKLKQLKLSLFGRYDVFDPDTDVDNNTSDRQIFGIAYHLPHHSKLILDYDRVHYEETSEKTGVWKIAMEVHF